jgi:hypothetical protein
MVEKTAAAAPGYTERHHPRPMAVYEHDVNAGDHCRLQAHIIDLQNTHKKMCLGIVSLLTDRWQQTLKPTAHNHLSCYRKQLRNSVHGVTLAIHLPYTKQPNRVASTSKTQSCLIWIRILTCSLPN